jgi:transmembrane sensor
MTRADEPADSTVIRAQAEAAAWMAFLHSTERNAGIEAALRRWIAADPIHAAKWEVATDLWNETANLPRRLPRSLGTQRRPIYPSVRLVSAACVVCLIGAGLAFQHFVRSGVSTAVGEQRALNLDDGTRVELNTESRIEVEYDHQTRRVVLKSGEAYFQVAHESRPFVVYAGDRKVIAVGTEFTVRRDESSDDSVTVTLIEGRLAVAPTGTTKVSPSGPAASEMTLLRTGQRLKVRRNGRLAVDVPSIDNVTGWMRGQLIFDHTPLREALAEFSRYTPTKITVMSPEVAEILVGGIFRVGDSKNFARAVAESHNLRLIYRDGGLVIE